jgi:hypothetical protein
MKFSTRRSVVLVAAGIAAVAWACESPGRPANLEPAVVAEGAKTHRQPSAHVRRVAEVHNRALLRFFANYDSYVGKRGKRTQQSRCDGLRRLTREVISEAAQTAGLQENAQLDHALADAMVTKANAGCGGKSQASLFIPKRAPNPDEVVTEAVVPHLEALQSGYNSMSDPYSGSISAVNNEVLSAASGQPTENYDIIYMTTLFAIDDASFWVGIGEALGDSGYCNPDVNPLECIDPPDEMTLFAPKAAWLIRALFGTVTDLGACIASEIVDAHAGNVSERDMYLHCAGYGAAASAALGMKWLGEAVETAIKAGTIRAM